MDKVYFRGNALTCSLGEDIDQIISKIKDRDITVEQLPVSLVGMPYTKPHYRLQKSNDLKTDASTEEYFYEILYSTIEKAFKDASMSQEEIESCAIFFGSTSIDIPIYERLYDKSTETESIFSHASPGYGQIISKVAAKYAIKGPCYTFTTACTSSANGIMYAASMIKMKKIKRALVIGYDLFNNLAFYGFESLKLIAKDAYHPFDKNRDGVILGEACGALILDGDKKHDDQFYYIGGANGCDTFNVTTHNTNGEEIAEVITESLTNSNLNIENIDVIKTHATGSENNDRTETNGMKIAFGDKIPPFTALKPYVGHTVGACGAVETIMLIESMKNGFIPGTVGFNEVDEELNIEPIVDHLSLNQGTIMCNFFGFGGNCTSFIISNK